MYEQCNMSILWRYSIGVPSVIRILYVQPLLETDFASKTFHRVELLTHTSAVVVLSITSQKT